MRLNENSKIVGERVILIPYESHHVEKYHQWMKSPELQQLTASEPLSLEEEYAMQKSWRNDEDKLTFLILNRSLYETNGGDEIAALIGDTNLFLQTDEDTLEKVAEAEIMIAEVNARGQHFGWEAMLLLLKYAQQNLSLDKFEAKIGYENSKSLKMFSKMHFKEVSRSAVFQEITLSCKITPEWIEWLNQQVKLKCEAYKS